MIKNGRFRHNKTRDNCTQLTIYLLEYIFEIWQLTLYSYNHFRVSIVILEEDGEIRLEHREIRSRL